MNGPRTAEFSLNDFLWIQRIRWIVTKSKSSRVTRDILYLTIDSFLDIVVKSNFPLLSIGWYLFRLVSCNRYLLRGSNENTLCITSTGNVSVARWVIPLVTILLLDLVMIHWIRWIQGKSFRETSTDLNTNDHINIFIHLSRVTYSIKVCGLISVTCEAYWADLNIWTWKYLP